MPVLIPDLKIIIVEGRTWVSPRVKREEPWTHSAGSGSIRTEIGRTWDTTILFTFHMIEIIRPNDIFSTDISTKFLVEISLKPTAPWEPCCLSCS
jgi:hypothetical protein